MIRNSSASTNNVSIELTKLTAEKNISEVLKITLKIDAETVYHLSLAPLLNVDHFKIDSMVPFKRTFLLLDMCM